MSTSTKRQDYITWDEYFMGVAMLSGMRSKDPNTQVGACIVSPEHKILSMGYNGFPLGCSDDEFSWSREGEDNKYYYSFSYKLLYHFCYFCLQKREKAEAFSLMISSYNFKCIMRSVCSYLRSVTPAALSIFFDAITLCVCSYLSLSYTTSLMPVWIIALAHSLHGNNVT